MLKISLRNELAEFNKRFNIQCALVINRLVLENSSTIYIQYNTYICIHIDFVVFKIPAKTIFRLIDDHIQDSPFVFGIIIRSEPPDKLPIIKLAHLLSLLNVEILDYCLSLLFTILSLRDNRLKSKYSIG